MVSILKEEALKFMGVGGQAARRGQGELARKRLYFFWVVREQQALGWVEEALREVHEAVGPTGCLDIVVYCTGGMGRRSPRPLRLRMLPRSGAGRRRPCKRALRLPAHSLCGARSLAAPPHCAQEAGRPRPAGRCRC